MTDYFSPLPADYRSAWHRGGGNSGRPHETAFLLWDGTIVIVPGWRL